MKINSLDIETEATDPSMKLFAALQPWRLRQGLARITSVAVCRPDYSVDQIINRGDNTLWLRELTDLLDSMSGEVAYAHNALFDTAFLIAQLQPKRMGDIPDVIKRVQWRDTGLLTKWLINGQLAETTRFSYSLSNLIATFLPDDPMTPYFIQMKGQGVSPGDNPEYWEKRGELDAIMTLKLAQKLQGHMTDPKMRTGFLTEQACLLPVANSWLMGIRIDQNQMRANEKYFLERKAEIARGLGVPDSIFTSTKALPQLVFGEWGMPVLSRTPSGAPQCNADTLKWLAYQQREGGNDDMAKKLEQVIEGKQMATLYSKYVKSMIKALEHTGDGYIYPAPRLFGTLTGRMTYSSTTMGKDFEEDGEGKKFKTSIAAHQIPRKDKMVRSSLVAPEGYEIYEADASGQESRLMALRSNDQTMIDIFNRDINFHSFTGASIIGEDYSDFQVKYKAEGDDGGYYTEQRQLGKLTNLSCNYRIGGKALANKAYLEYDTFLTIQTGIFLVNTFNRTYKGVPQYWEDVVWEAKQQGFVQTFGGRRYKLTDWNQYRWATESSAINVPIQGAGADMKEIAIKETFEKVPEFIFCLDLHDATFGYIREEDAERVHKKLDEVLNNIDYEQYWGFKPAIHLPYESKRGATWAQVK